MKLINIDQVEQRVGKSQAPRDLKVLDYIDTHATRWLSFSHFAFMAFGQAGSIQISAAGGDEGFVSVSDAKHLQFQLDALDEASVLEKGLSFGTLFMVSGMDETLRVNGKVTGIENGVVTLNVEECYLHCAKSFMRSNFWLPKSAEQSHTELSDFLQQATFLVLATINKHGQADVSPKGDPENFLIQEEGGFICFADRPGNRRIDSFRNILEQPTVSIIALVPGCKNVLELSGTAELCADEQLLNRFTVQGKKPKLVTKINLESSLIKPSKAISKSALWPAKEAPKDLNPAEIFKSHIKHSKEKSLKAKVVRAAVSLPGAFEAGLDLDYKNNIY